MSQTEKILAALQSRPVTALDALRDFGCFRLAARINNLRALGHDIRTEMIETDTGAKVAMYTLNPPKTKGQAPHEQTT